MGKQGKRTGRTPASSDKDKSPKTTPPSSSSSPLSSPKDKEKPKPDTSTELNNPPFYLDLTVASNSPLTSAIDSYEVAANKFRVSNNSTMDAFIINAIHNSMLTTLKKAYGKIEDETVFVLSDVAKQCYSPTAINSQVFRFTKTSKPKECEPLYRILASYKGIPDAKPIIHCEIPQPYLEYYYKCGMSVIMNKNVPEAEYDKYLHLFSPHLQRSFAIYKLLLQEGRQPSEAFRDTVMAASDGNYYSTITLETLVLPDPPAIATKQTSDTTGNVNADNGPRTPPAPPIEVTRDSRTAESIDTQVRTAPTGEATRTATPGTPRHSDSHSSSSFAIHDYDSSQSGHSGGSPHSTQSAPSALMSPESVAAELLRTDNIPGAQRTSSASNIPLPIPEGSPVNPDMSTLTDEHIRHARGHHTVLNRTESIDFGNASSIHTTADTSVNVPPQPPSQQSTGTGTQTGTSPRTSTTTPASPSAPTQATPAASSSTATATAPAVGRTSSSATTRSANTHRFTESRTIGTTTTATTAAAATKEES
jgi:hypothetical protein